jgi:PKD repeat protein
MMVGLLASSCSDDDGDTPDPVEDPIASFQFEVDDTNFLEVTFTNFSQNATSYSWDFGDGSAASTDESPVYTYAAAGDYTVTLTASNADGATSTKSENLTITDPNAALTLLSGLESKSWKLLRDGAAIGIGPSYAEFTSWFANENDGSRPCFYDDEFTFTRAGGFEFDDAGTFWGESNVYGSETDKNALFETCFEATVENLTIDGVDKSAWLSSTSHSYDYDPTAGTITLTGLGAWMGLIKLGTNGDVDTPQETTTFNALLADGGETGVDTLDVWWVHADGANYWRARYVSYADPLDEPDLVSEAAVFGEDLDDITPTTMSHSFASATDFVELGTIGGASVITVGVDDPADATAAKVGQFDRVGTEAFQEATLRVNPDPKDINFTSLTTVTLDVYLPSSNDYSGALSKTVLIGMADQSATEQWWNGLVQFESASDLAEDTWHTLTFDLATPSFASLAGDTPLTRNDFDMIFINIGSGNHTVAGTFYIRNLSFQ